jgi:hypothetical protein
MKTDELIAFLSDGHTPVDPRRIDRLLVATVAAALVGVSALVVLTLGTRPDIAVALAAPAVWIKHALTLLLLAAATIAFQDALRPTTLRPRALLPLLVIAVIGVLAVAQLAASPVSQWSALVFGRYWYACLLLVPVYAVLPFMGLVWVARDGAPVHLRAAGALAGCLAGALGAAGYVIHCTDDAVPFLFVWYGLPILATTLIGAALGPRLLRW